MKMPDLGHLSSSASLKLTRCAISNQSSILLIFRLQSSAMNQLNICPVTIWDQWFPCPLPNDDEVGGNYGIRVSRARGDALDRSKRNCGGKTLEDHVKSWVRRKLESGVPQSRCSFPFLVGARKMECFICKQRLHWKSIRCTIASHDKCAPWPDKVVHLKNQPGTAICWRHPSDWHVDLKSARCSSDECPCPRQVEGETRGGVFAARSIEVGEPLTYDYRFVQFGPEVKCHCGAPNCQRYLGTKKRSALDLFWGTKRRRTSAARITGRCSWVNIAVHYNS